MTAADEQDERWEQIARWLASESSAEEAAALEAWLAAEPGRRELVARLRDVTAELAFAAPADLDVEAALARVHQRMDAEAIGAPTADRDVVRIRDITSAPRPGARPFWRSRTLQIAAAVVLLLAANWLVQRLQTPGPALAPVAARTYQTGIGRADTIQLADGSTVVLAPASRLVVGEGYGGTARSVALEGVAWFRVTPDARRAFTVRAGTAVVTDLGTAFTVRADPQQPVVVAVTEGSVRLAPETAAEAGIILAAGEHGTVADGVATALSRSTGEPLAWTGGRLEFADAPFPQVAAELYRWYGVTLVAGDRTVAGRHLTSEFEGESLPDVLAVLALALDARTEIRGDTVVLHSRP